MSPAKRGTRSHWPWNKFTTVDSLWAIIFGYIYCVSIRKGIAIAANTQKLRRKIIAYTQTEERKNMSDQKTTRIYKESVSNDYSLHVKPLCVEKCLINAA